MTPRAPRPALVAVLAGALGLAALPAAPAAAQGADPLAEARRLREAGRLEAAEARLRDRLAAAPRDADARWLLAHTLYWMGRLEEARAEYRRALESRPGESALRLDAARFLSEAGWPEEARTTLAPLLEVRDRLAPDLAAEAARVEAAAIRGSAPWVAVRPAASRDDQPLTAAEVEVEGGWFPARGVAAALRATPVRLSGDGREVTVTALAAGLEARRPDWPVEAGLAVGASLRSEPDGADAIGRLALALRLPRETRLAGEARRSRYLRTVASLEEPDLLVETAEVALDRSGAARWAGRVGARVDRFPDGNEIVSAHAWALAPLLVRAGGSLRVGYAFESQDAGESRFDPATGLYAPYYTPERLVAHSAVLAARLDAGPGAALHADGAVGLWAEERAPSAGPAGRVAFEDRSFTPWRARARLEADVSATARLLLEVEHRRSAFFEITRGGLGLEVRLAR